MGRAFIAFCLGIFVLFGSASIEVTPPVTTYLLIIGVNNMAEGNDDVFAEEAEYLRNALVVRLNNFQERTLLRKEAIRENCLQGLKWIGSKPTDNDIVIIYISAHGCDTEKGFAFRAYDERVQGYEIIERLSQLHCKTLFMVDTCKAGAMVRDWHCADNVGIVAACQADQWAACWKFTVGFVEALSEADYDHNHAVDLNEIKQFLPLKMKEIGSHQVATYSDTKLNLVLAHIK